MPHRKEGLIIPEQSGNPCQLDSYDFTHEPRHAETQ